MDWDLLHKRYKQDHNHLIHHRSQKDIFFVWMILAIFSVLAGFLLFDPRISGMVVLEETAQSSFLVALLVLFAAIFVAGVVHFFVSRQDHH